MVWMETFIMATFEWIAKIYSITRRDPGLVDLRADRRQVEWLWSN